MSFKKETFIFLTALALILIVTYINVIMSTNNNYDTSFLDEETLKNGENDLAETVNDENIYYISGQEEIKDEMDEVGSEEDKMIDSIEAAMEDDSIISVTDTTDLGDVGDIGNLGEAEETSSMNEDFNMSFENLKISKAKNNLDIVDQIENSLSNSELTDSTKAQFEELLIVKNNQIQMENNIEIMLQSKGYNDFICIVSTGGAKVITNQDIEKADANIILDIVENETKYTAEKIKIVKFNN